MTAAKDVKPNRFYTRDHEWALAAGNEVVVGITAFAVDQLGDITLVDLSIAPGQRLDSHQCFGTIESVKTLSDLFSPVSGKVVRVNQELLEHPELVNDGRCRPQGAASAPSWPSRRRRGSLEVLLAERRAGRAEAWRSRSRPSHLGATFRRNRAPAPAPRTRRAARRSRARRRQDAR